jgi:hypothetical protein
VKVHRYAFDKDIIGDSLLFKVPELNSVTLYATRPFIKLIKELKVTGIEFEKLWEG